MDTLRVDTRHARPLAGRPYVLRDGRVVAVRSVAPEDAPRLAELFERLSRTSSRQRFFSADRRPTAQEVSALADVDHLNREAVVAVHGERIVALGGFHRLGDSSGAELTLLVDDAYQGCGLGRHLLMVLIAAASACGLTTLLAEVLPDNERTLRLLETAGPPTLVDPYFGVLRVFMYLGRQTLP
jgi:ribosomal protein S18 acetylase RimI-like enzyme